jgi:hypothetical protein
MVRRAHFALLLHLGVGESRDSHHCSGRSQALVQQIPSHLVQRTGVPPLQSPRIRTDVAPPLGMDLDRIRTGTNSDVNICHNLFRMRIRIQLLTNTNAKRMFRIQICIRITRFIP